MSLDRLIQNDDLDMIRLIFQPSEDTLSHKDENGKTVIMKAIEMGRVEIIRIILSNWYDNLEDCLKAQDNEGRSVLEYAILYYPNTSITELLLPKFDVNDILTVDKNNEGKTLFMRVIENRNIEIIRLLANVDYINTFEIDNNNNNILHYAVRTRNLEIVRIIFDLVVQGIAFVGPIAGTIQTYIENENNQHITVLHLSIRLNLSNILSFFIQNGANINYTESTHNKTLLMLALMNRKYYALTHIIRLLISNGIDVNLPDDLGYTPLMILAIQIPTEVQSDIFNELITAGANVNMTNSTGKTALNYAARKQNENMISLLIKNGADPQIGNPPPYNDTLVQRYLSTQPKQRSALSSLGLPDDLLEKVSTQHNILTDTSRIDPSVYSRQQIEPESGYTKAQQRESLARFPLSKNILESISKRQERLRVPLDIRRRAEEEEPRRKPSLEEPNDLDLDYDSDDLDQLPEEDEEEETSQNTKRVRSPDRSSPLKRPKHGGRKRTKKRGKQTKKRGGRKRTKKRNKKKK
jgi:ankyrin repeat protein